MAEQKTEKGVTSRVVRHLRRRRFVRAYYVLRDEAARHKAAGHDVEFIAVNESRILLMCHGCPDFPSTPYPVIPPGSIRGVQ